ncbi:LuxR C-terminal-related transcriptional regulator [Aquihabitans sp. G128]|uniref:LuxR C-terminal-related transcriptional regulator n=1 Tax=Aquihabitans sp. G128 TaxID=2849779 RepID=UPI001C2392DA|nr:LuxR C-terminal-related transcriptional regulator [Aquihabitans sp. G128]QXC60659.1 LuxR C-terminal-related transcriptional regulator [Aquihabitans sp. G128]
MTDQAATGPLLLATKLHAPLRPDLVPRARLRTQMERRGQPGLTLVSAAAGFGKTTLVAEWFALGPSTAWLSLDGGDNDPATFWAYVIAAIQTVDHRLASEAGALVRDPSASIETITTTLVNELHAAGEQLVVVLDDYHVIETAEIHQAVAFLLEHLPSHVRLVIATRADPPLPLAALRAQGDLLEIRAADLRFTSEEATAYLTETMGLTLTTDDVERLGARTEGWIAALQLAALSMQGRADVAGFIADFAGDDRFILDYLVGEVLDRQGPSVRTFLLETSILGRLTGPLCDAVTGGHDGRTTLEHLDRDNLFVVPLDDRRSWYRYHHLFADVLRAHLLDEEADRVPELHRRASDWYDGIGQAGEAIVHALEGGDAERAAELIEVAAPAMQQSRQERTLRDWLERLPADVYADRPVLALTLVGTRMATGATAGVEALLQLVEAAMSRTSPPPIVVDAAAFERLPAQVAVQRSGLALLTGDLDATITHATRVLDLVGPDDHLRRGSANALIGLALWARGDLVEAERRYRDAVQHLRNAGYLSDALGCSIALADILLAQGRLGDAAHTLEAGLRLTAEDAGLRGAADMHVGLCEVLLEQGDLEGAAQHLAASADFGDPAGLPQHPYRRRVAAARLCAARGSFAEASTLLEEAVPLYDTDFSPPVRPVTALRARVQLAEGDLGAAQRWATDRHLSIDDEPTYVDEYAHLTLARILLAHHRASGDPTILAGATQLLGRLLTAAEDGHRTASAIEALTLLASAQHAASDSRAAVASLADAARRAEPEGQLQVFVDAGPSIVGLLRKLASVNGAPTLTHRALAAIEGSGTSPGRGVRSTGLVEDLSARELDVLRLLKSELGGPEIARELHVSLNTLRTHTKHIYTKLAVNNRREALRRAAELGL